MKYQQAYHTDWLLNLIRSGEPPEYMFFWGHRAKPNTVTKACFSQWWPSSFTVEGNTYETAEHWMMAHKAKLFGADDIYAKILDTPDPGAVKGLGRKVENFDPALWDLEKFDVVAQGNLHKFQQNEDIRKFLLSTGDKVLVEASPVDFVWGIGLAQDDENAHNPANWKGPNLLGYALMTVRDLLRA